MIKNISKICSFLLLFLLSVLALNEFQIMNYSENLKKIFYFLTLILIMFSSVTTLLTNKSGFFKFVSVVIMLALVVGGVISILNPGLNISLYVCLILTVVYSMVDMFYKVAWFIKSILMCIYPAEIKGTLLFRLLELYIWINMFIIAFIGISRTWLTGIHNVNLNWILKCINKQRNWIHVCESGIRKWAVETS